MDALWKALELVVAGALTSAILGTLARHRRAAAERGFGAEVLRYPTAMRVVAWALLLVPVVGILALARFQPPKPDEVVYVVGLLIGFGLLGGALVLEARGVAHELRPGGLERVTPWRRRAWLSWSQVQVLRFSDAMQCWRIVTSTGEATWISVYVSGLAAFARAALERVRPEVIDRVPGTRAKLEALARGELPPSVV
jgi:hypothetical protein